MSQCPSCGAWQGVPSVAIWVTTLPSTNAVESITDASARTAASVAAPAASRAALSDAECDLGYLVGCPLRVVVGVGGVGQGHDAQDGRIRDGVAVFAYESFNVGGVAGNDFSVLAD